MKPKVKVKIAIDVGMTIVLLLLMAYELIGQAVHEWIGVFMFVLFILHHVLNGKWTQSLMKGKYTVLRSVQTGLVLLILIFMLGSMFSGIILSRHVLADITIRGLRSFARNLHMLSAYWGFVLMSLHLGFHWSMMMGMAGKLVKKPSKIRKWILRGIAVLVAGYGIYAFIRRDIGSYMLLKNQFVFFDFEEPVVFFMLDYIVVMGLFVCTGHYLSEGLKKILKKSRS